MKTLEILEELIESTNTELMIQREMQQNKLVVNFVESDSKLKEDLLSVMKKNKVVFITDRGFAGKYLDSLGLFDIIYKITREDLRNVEEAKKVFMEYGCRAVVGFGGGRSLDVAKKLAYDMNAELILVPTAPSHDGIASRTSSLYDNGIKKSFLCKYPSEIVVPLQLWERAERHKKSGMMDVLSNIISLQDVFLSHRICGERIRTKELRLSSAAVLFLIKSDSLRELAMALFSSALAMRDSSRYCSGSEHELEKALAPHFPDYMHGELVGISSLICAYLYGKHEEVPHDLLFQPEILLEELIELYKRKGLMDTISSFFEDQNFLKNAPEFMKNASKIRPERYTLWNVVDSNQIDFRAALKEIESKL